MPSDRLLRCIFEELHMEEMVLAMRDGAQLANLRLLLEYARTYERAGYRGLSGSIRYIDRLQEQRSDLAPAAVLSESANVVRIMSIHHSKGLEFPFVFLADTARKFNTSSQMGDLLIHPELGVGLKPEGSGQRSAFYGAYDAVQLETARDELSEQLRVLYVAVTRAREKLFLLASCNSPEKRLAQLAAQQMENGRLLPFDVRSAGSFADWILSALLRHRDGAALRRLAGAEEGSAAAGERVENSMPHSPPGGFCFRCGDGQLCAPDEALLEKMRAVFAAKPGGDTALSLCRSRLRSLSWRRIGNGRSILENADRGF